jgi:hypothetical protein
VQLLGTGLYIGYLVQVGLLMIYLPWSRLWGLLIARLPPNAAWLLDAPAVRGALTGFGVLHLVMVCAELVAAGAHDRQSRRPADPSRGDESPSQSSSGS